MMKIWLTALAVLMLMPATTVHAGPLELVGGCVGDESVVILCEEEDPDNEDGQYVECVDIDGFAIFCQTYRWTPDGSCDDPGDYYSSESHRSDLDVGSLMILGALTYDCWGEQGVHDCRSSRFIVSADSPQVPGGDAGIRVNSYDCTGSHDPFEGCQVRVDAVTQWMNVFYGPCPWTAPERIIIGGDS